MRQALPHQDKTDDNMSIADTTAPVAARKVQEEIVAYLIEKALGIDELGSLALGLRWSWHTDSAVALVRGWITLSHHLHV
jgi:hypothetical protein